MGAQAAIEEARPKIESGELPASLAPPFNAFVDGYNEARAAMLAYDAATDDQEALDAVERALSAMQRAWLAWTSARSEVP